MIHATVQYAVLHRACQIGKWLQRRLIQGVVPMVQQCLHVTSKMDRQKMGAMMEGASWSFWHVKEKIDFKKAGIQSFLPQSTVADHR